MTVDTDQFAALTADVAATAAKAEAVEAVLGKMIRFIVEAGGPDMQPMPGRHRAPGHVRLIQGGRR